MESPAVTGGGAFSIRKFDGRNFAVWKAQVLAYLTLKGCQTVLTLPRPPHTIKADEKELRKEQQEEWDDMNNRAKALLLLSVDDDRAMMVIGFKTARDIWNRLVDSYESSSQASKILIRRTFYDAQMREGENISAYVARVSGIFNQLTDAGVFETEETLVNRIVAGLTPRYHSFMTQWANNVMLPQTMGELLPRLIAEEGLIKKFSKMESVALIGETKKPSYPKPFKNSNEPFRPHKNKPKPKKDKTKMACHNCGDLGHFKRECKKPAKKEEVMVAEGIVAEVFEACRSVSDSDWILDSGASDHMTCDDRFFISYKEFDQPLLVRLGDSNTTRGLGSGSIRMLSDVKGTKTSFILKDVIYVPDIRRKLISISAATSRKMCGFINENEIVIKNKYGGTILIASKQGGLYRCFANEAPQVPRCFNAETDDDDEWQGGESDLKLWHERLAHISKATIVKMKKLQMVTGLEKCVVEKHVKASDRRVIDCQTCCLAKQVRLPTPLKSRERSSVVGGRLHVDICGAIQPATLKGAHYIVLFKDEYSTYRIAYFIKSKKDAYDAVRDCIARVKADTGKSVACLVSDQGSEFTSNKMQDYLKTQCIAHEVSAEYTPQQNGFIERENRTVLEATRSMLYHRKVAEKLWGEAANTAIYILNRVPNKQLKNKTPFELYFGRKPRVAHLRVFGCVAFVKQQEKKRKGYQRKLEPRAKKLILVGYDKDFTYRLFDPEKNDVLLSREVLFDERELDLADEGTYEFLDEHISVEAEEAVNDDAQSVTSQISDESERGAEANIVVLTADNEPQSYDQAISSTESVQWQAAMQDEYNSLVSNGTWVLAVPPANIKLVNNKWVYRLKRNIDGSIARFKARLVAKGFTQRYGIDYFETFSPVVRLESIRIILSIVAREDLDLVHFDIKTAFLNGVLQEEVWMAQPQGFEKGNNLACKLSKSIYGLKQASRVWNECFISFLKKFQLNPINCDSCVLVRRDSKSLLIVAVYVDDGLVCSNDNKLIEQVISYLRERFDITLMAAECFVGLEISRNRAEKTLTISQSRYIKALVDRFDLADSIPIATPMCSSLKLVKSGVADSGEISRLVNVRYREAVGCLMYAMAGSRPDISYAVHVVSKFCEQPRLPHWLAVKRIIKYLKGTADLGIKYDGRDDVLLTSFSDADYADWRSTKQSTVAESTTEAEFIACSTLSREVIWARNFLAEVYAKPLEAPTDCLVDNQSAIKLIGNNQIHSKIKHLDVRLMAVRERQENHQVKVKYVGTNDQVADIMTKPLPPAKFKHFRERLVMALTILMVVLACTGSTSGFKITLGRFASAEEPLHLVLKMKSPCDVAEKAEEQLRGTIVLSSEAKFNSSLINLTKSFCKGTYEDRIVPAFNNLNGCLPAFNPALRRNKRSLTTVVGAIGAAADLVVGVTNLIRGSAGGASVASRQDTFNELAKIVEANSKSALTDESSRTNEMERELEIVSGAANSHIEEAMVESSKFPMLMWTTYHTAAELAAGLANLKAIRRYCTEGRLATMEIAEMLEDGDLATLPPEDTILLSISVDQSNTEADFVYRVKKEFHLTVVDFTIATGVVFGVVLIIVLIAANLHVISTVSENHRRHIEHRKIEHVRHRPHAVSGPRFEAVNELSIQEVDM